MLSRSPRVALTALAAILIAVALAAPAAAFNADALVTVGSPLAPFSQNKQNEPAVAIDANHPTMLVAGSNDEIDMEACNAGTDNTCPFTPGVGVSGVYFSFDSGTTWTQPTYTGLTARDCLGAVGDTDPACIAAHRADRDAAALRRERAGLRRRSCRRVRSAPGPGGFSWANGSRLYYANLTANVAATRTDQAFKGFEAIAVSRTDNPAAAAAGDAGAWKAPVLVSKQSSTTFSDKEQVWADNAVVEPVLRQRVRVLGVLRRPGEGQRGARPADRGGLP